MQIQNDVYWIDTGSVNVYLCRDDDGLTLIDTGMPRKADFIVHVIERFGFAPADVRRILLTHADVDHAGSLAALLARTGAAAYAGAASAACVAEGRGPRHLPWLMQTLGDPFTRFDKLPAATFTIFRDGDTLPVLGGLLALATPGHSPDHFSFYAPGRGVLFAGDALNGRRGRVRRSPPIMTGDEEAANRSARRLLALDPTVVACGHGAPLILDDPGLRAAAFDDLRRKVGQ